MYFHLVIPLAIGAVALAMLTVSLGRNEYAAFIALMVSATSQASNPLEWGYPATYLHGPALSSGWAVANCISAYGGMPSRRTALHGIVKSEVCLGFIPILLRIQLCQHSIKACLV